MKLNINFANKIPKVAKNNEVIFLKEKSIKRKDLNQLSKTIFSDKLFLEQNFLKKDHNNK